MKQIKVFKGKINGEVFDNVHSYNTRMTELISAGVTDIEASSSTSIRMVDDSSTELPTGIDSNVCACDDIDEDLSIYPYFDIDDPKYLDLLVTNNPTTNTEAYNEASKILDKCYLYIMDNLYNEDVDIDTKKEYLEGVRRIISDIKQDNTNTSEALRRLDVSRAQAAAAFREAQAVFAEAQAKYNAATQDCDSNQQILHSAKPIIAMMLEFYHSVEQSALEAIADAQAKNCCDHDMCSTREENKCTCSTPDTTTPKVTCNVREVKPQQLSDVSDWFNRVLEACGL